uniref:Uncharacterized protein n=1 Tax=Oncorhynchus mykiss TaxID=8022 RepID=A0A8K9XU47_ONCMY
GEDKQESEEKNFPSLEPRWTGPHTILLVNDMISCDMHGGAQRNPVICTEESTEI